MVGGEMRPVLDLLRQYRLALREEPKLRAYIAASIVDDIGVAISGWASMLLMTNLFVDQRARAQLALPSLCCFLVGAVISGPLADWTTTSVARLAGFRHRLVVVARLVETVMLAGLVVIIARATPTIGRILPYVMLTAFMKTALYPTRAAFGIDLLQKEEVQRADDGGVLHDERGAPLVYKRHLLTFASLTQSLRMFAALVGLLLGGQIMRLAGHRYWVLFALDVVTNLGFIVIVAKWCKPSVASDAAVVPPREGAVVRFGKSMREGIAFLAAPQQRLLLVLLTGSFIIEVVTEMYDGKMIMKHVLHGSDDSVRYGVIAYSVCSALALACMPVLTRRVGNLGRIFLVAMLLDGVVIAIAGHIAGQGNASAIRPFIVALTADHALTLMSSTLIELAQNSASSTAIRGRISALYALVVLLGDMGAEVIATRLAETIGIPAMLTRVGLVQVAAMVFIALLFGKRLWRFGLRVEPATPTTSEPLLSAAQ